MSQIFLSYNREDAATAKRFADAFTAEGLSVWWDVTLRSGEAYDEVTEAALRSAKAVVVLWSPRSVVSRWVRAEATLADRAKTLVPVRIEACDLPIMFELTQTADLSHWKGDAGDKAWQAFLSDVRGHVGSEVEPPVAQAPLPAAPTVQETLKPGQSGSAPSLAVLPFTNRSGLQEDDVFAEGMVEDVISALSQGVNVRVLGSMATANLGRATLGDVAAVGRQLGVRYLLEGNVRRVGASLRVTTQLLEAASGEVLWMGKFNRPLAELAALQEELVTEVAASLDTQVYNLEMERALKKPNNITAWEAVARGWSTYYKYDRMSLERAIEHGMEAVTIAPDFARGHALLAVVTADTYLSYCDDDPAEVERIRAIAERALALSSDNALVLADAGEALCFIGYPEEAERYTGLALAKLPGSGRMHYSHGLVCQHLGQPDKALRHFEIAERLMPNWHIIWALKAYQSASFRNKRLWAESLAAIEACMKLVPDAAFPFAMKAVCCAYLDREAEARECVESALRRGWVLALAERFNLRREPNSPTLDADIATLRALYAGADRAP